MSVSKSLRQDGLLTYPDSVRIVHHRYTHKARESARRFSRLRKRIGKREHSAPGVFITRLVVLDMVRPSQVHIAAIAIPYSHLNRPMVEWICPEDERLDRRQLCSLTLLSWQTYEHTSPPTEELLALLKTDPDYKHFSDHKALERLEIDFCHWASRNLSGPMYAHVTGIAPMHAVSRETLGRLELKAVALANAQDIDQDYELEIADFQDAAAEASASDDTDALIKYAIGLIEKVQGLTEKEKFKKWALIIANLKDQVIYSSINTSIILCSMLDLAESGTYRSPDAPLATRLRNIKNGPINIHRALRAMGTTIDKATEDQLSAAYISILEDPNLKDPGATSAALSQFKHFAEDVWGIPEVTINSTKYTPSAKPRVQMVHQHEIDLCLEWLATQDGADIYALQIASLQLQLLYQFPTRIDELRYVRLSNLSLSKDLSKAELELYPATGRRFKNLGSARRATYDNPKVILLLNEWKKMRLEAGADLDDFIFGIDDLPNIYRKSTVTAILRICLKVATGDANIVIHALRHTASSNDFELSQTSSPNNTNKYFTQAERKGHVAPPMGFEYYIHRFEKQLFDELTKCNRRNIQYVSSDSDTFKNQKAGAVRTNSSRSGGSNISSTIHDSLDKIAASIQLDPIADSSKWFVPKVPQLTLAGTFSLTPLLIHKVIVLAYKKSAREISVVHSIPLSVVQSICTEAMSLAQEEQAKLSPAKRAKVIPATTVSEAVDHLKLDLISAKQAKYNSLRSKLSKSIDLEHARQIADVYPDIVKSDIYVRLDYEYLSTNLLGALHAFNVEPNILLVRFQPCLRQPEKLRALISNISEQFQSKWNHIPPLEEDDISHDSRPDAYLMWPIRPGDHSPRSVEVHGLIVLIFCISIYYRIKVRKHVPS